MFQEENGKTGEQANSTRKKNQRDPKKQRLDFKCREKDSSMPEGGEKRRRAKSLRISKNRLPKSFNTTRREHFLLEDKPNLNSLDLNNDPNISVEAKPTR